MYLGRDKKTVDMPRMNVSDIHIKFLNACKNAGIKSTEHPLNYDLARRSLYRYINHIHNLYFEEASSRFGDDVQRNVILSGNSQSTILPVRPFEQVQFDGHKIE